MYSPHEPIILGYEIKNEVDVNTFILNERDLIHRRFFYAIKESFLKYRDDAIILRVPHIKFRIISNKIEWGESLDSGLLYFESIEDYEMCIEIKRLQEIIQEDYDNN